MHRTSRILSALMWGSFAVAIVLTMGLCILECGAPSTPKAPSYFGPATSRGLAVCGGMLRGECALALDKHCPQTVEKVIEENILALDPECWIGVNSPSQSTACTGTEWACLP